MIWIAYKPENGSLERVYTIHGAFIPGEPVCVPQEVAAALLPRMARVGRFEVNRGTYGFVEVEPPHEEKPSPQVIIVQEKRAGSIAQAARKKQRRK